MGRLATGSESEPEVELLEEAVASLVSSNNRNGSGCSAITGRVVIIGEVSESESSNCASRAFTLLLGVSSCG